MIHHRTVTIHTATGAVASDVRGGPEHDLGPAPAGFTRIGVANDLQNYDQMRWNGTAFEASPDPVVDSEDLPLTPREQRQFLQRISDKTDLLT
jgi:hypothetical protein